MGGGGRISHEWFKLPGTSKAKERKPQPDDLMTTGEAGRLLGLSADMVRWLENEGRLPAQRTTNGVRLFRRSDVEKLAAERARGNASDETSSAPPDERARSSRDGNRRGK
jgi:excisionase family DNA binding protein